MNHAVSVRVELGDMQNVYSTSAAVLSAVALVLASDSDSW